MDLSPVEYEPLDADVESLADTEPIGAAELVELILLLPVRRRASRLRLRSAGSVYALEVVRGRTELGRLVLDREVAARAIGMLARLAHLDPLVEPHAGSSATNLARITIRSGRSCAVVVVSVVALLAGLECEISTLALDGAPPATETALKRCSLCGAFAPPGDSHCERDRAPLLDVEDDPRPGGTVGVHRIEAELGRGATGIVLAATHVFLGRPTAIKILHDSLARNQQQRRAFLAEARAASRVRHPELLEVSDYGVLPDGRPFVVMERIDGEPLSRQLEGGRALRPRHALAIARSVARALSAAHHAGVVHNDLKPSNIMILASDREEEPALKVIDFGAASLLELRHGHRDEVIGTPHYMSPEHIRGESTDGRSDVYALGVVLYRLLTGRLPFDADEIRALLTAHLEAPPPTLTSPHGPLDPSVVRLVSRALEKDPADRQQSADELVLEIEHAMSRLQTPAWKRWLS